MKRENEPMIRVSDVRDAFYEMMDKYNYNIHFPAVKMDIDKILDDIEHRAVIEQCRYEGYVCNYSTRMNIYRKQ